METVTSTPSIPLLKKLIRVNYDKYLILFTTFIILILNNNIQYDTVIPLFDIFETILRYFINQ